MSFNIADKNVTLEELNWWLKEHKADLHVFKPVGHKHWRAQIAIDRAPDAPEQHGGESRDFTEAICKAMQSVEAKR